MNSKTVNFSQLKKVALGTVVVIGICALVFNDITQVTKAALINQTKTIATTYSTTLNNTKQHELPEGYIKAAYQTKLSDFSGQPGAKDMSMDEAAELGAQNLWRFFRVDLDGKTIEMSYRANSSFNPRAEWEGIIFIDKIASYSFTVDAVTGEHRTISQSKYWSGDINIGMDMNLLKNHEQYVNLAREMAEKFQVVTGKIVSVEYAGQGYSSDKDGVNPDISMLVKAANGQQAQLTFSRYNQELLTVEYDAWLKDARVYEEQMKKEMQKRKPERAVEVHKSTGAPSLIEIK